MIVAFTNSKGGVGKSTLAVCTLLRGSTRKGGELSLQMPTFLDSNFIEHAADHVQEMLDGGGFSLPYRSPGGYARSLGTSLVLKLLRISAMINSRFKVETKSRCGDMCCCGRNWYGCDNAFFCCG